LKLLKSKATQQITRLRLELENNHVAELRELREAYEHEKSHLQEELSRLTAAFDDVNRVAAAAVSTTRQSAGGGGRHEDDDDYNGGRGERTEPRPNNKVSRNRLSSHDRDINDRDNLSEGDQVANFCNNFLYMFSFSWSKHFLKRCSS